MLCVGGARPYSESFMLAIRASSLNIHDSRILHALGVIVLAYFRWLPSVVEGLLVLEEEAGVVLGYEAVEVVKRLGEVKSPLSVPRASRRKAKGEWTWQASDFN